MSLLYLSVVSFSGNVGDIVLRSVGGGGGSCPSVVNLESCLGDCSPGVVVQSGNFLFL